MTDIDYDALRGETGGDPPDGMHDASLVRAAIVETQNGTRLVTEWQISHPTPYYWTAWHGFDGQRLNWTQEYLDGLGVDRATITDDDALTEQLENVTGIVYEVRVQSKNGFLNTYVEGPAAARQESLDLPIATDDLPPAGVASAAAPTTDPADDDIPF